MVPAVRFGRVPEFESRKENWGLRLDGVPLEPIFQPCPRKSQLVLSLDPALPVGTSDQTVPERNSLA